MKKLKFIPVRVTRTLGPEITVHVDDNATWAEERAAMVEASVFQSPYFEKAPTQLIWEFGVFPGDA